MWKELKRRKIEVARRTVARLMGDLGLSGVVRGRAFKKSTRRQEEEVAVAGLN